MGELFQSCWWYSPGEVKRFIIYLCHILTAPLYAFLFPENTLVVAFYDIIKNLTEKKTKKAEQNVTRFGEGLASSFLLKEIVAKVEQIRLLPSFNPILPLRGATYFHDDGFGIMCSVVSAEAEGRYFYDFYGWNSNTK